MNKFQAHILVVDDDEGIRELVKQFLNENNFLITTANSAEDANKKIALIKFDLIILDIMMPGKTGLEFTITDVFLSESVHPWFEDATRNTLWFPENGKVIKGFFTLLPNPEPKFQEYELICPDEIEDVLLKLVGEPWQTWE